MSQSICCIGGSELSCCFHHIPRHLMAPPRLQRHIWKGANANLCLYWPSVTKPATSQHELYQEEMETQSWILEWGPRLAALPGNGCLWQYGEWAKIRDVSPCSLLQLYGFIFLSRLALGYGKALRFFPQERFAEVLTWYKSIKL